MRVAQEEIEETVSEDNEGANANLSFMDVLADDFGFSRCPSVVSEELTRDVCN